jgi:hypothetical protein
MVRVVAQFRLRATCVHARSLPPLVKTRGVRDDANEEEILTEPLPAIRPTHRGRINRYFCAEVSLSFKYEALIVPLLFAIGSSVG